MKTFKLFTFSVFFMKKILTKIIDKNWLNEDITLDCGQAFRWEKLPGGSMHGVAFGRSLTVSETEDKIILENCGEEDFENIWRGYFDLDRDYEKICEGFSAHSSYPRRTISPV